MRLTCGFNGRGDSNQWEVILSHKDPFTGKMIPTYHTITVSHAIGNGEGGFYVKEPKTQSSRREIPWPFQCEHDTEHLRAMLAEAERSEKLS